MDNKILALLDGSDYSHSVCHHTAWIAQKLGASVDAMHVLGRREGAATTDLSGNLALGARTALLTELATLDEQRAKLAQAKGHAILEDAKAILEQDGVAGVKLHLRKGDLLEAVQAVETGVRAITIGKRGEAHGYADGHLGSNLERIIRASKVPVFVASRAFKPISKVLVAYDASASAKVAIDRMAGSPVFADLPLTVLCVGQDAVKAQAIAEQAVARLQRADVAATALTASGEPEDVLKELVTTEGFNLLVMGAYGHSRIRSLVIGSTTTAMIRTAGIPVLLYR
ncbi:universal stress protein [Sulfitobacter guttiformis]|uniref:Nucleotide-binding universal stress UspA family protein n=1 Tax=Sulfitobacter guttiformis TaxID=74349 RepID=A0A420DPJ8_9RHOB|nr:universal stress protein [Sulfitobacter guttiformis]KIN73549.1 UspA protein [Sulfitobacter guttiformis KCTC 32187]RKE96196.1 nucleotide-binding universal stress UspA family protein [Sulfitobacter guttiformis]